MPARSPAKPHHFAINADDVDRARRFYETVFDWRFEPWGPPGFFMIDTGQGIETPVHGSLQGRREIVPGERINGLECTFSVADVDAVAAAVTASGGTVVMPKVLIPTVGWLIFFKDTEGNVIGAIQPAADTADRD